jgi:hypothetical protein
MNLVVAGDRSTGGEIPDVLAERLATTLAFNCKLRLAVAQYDEVDFPADGIAQKPQGHVVALRVFAKVAIFEQVRRHQIFKAGGFVLAQGPVPQIELALLICGFRRE